MASVPGSAAAPYGEPHPDSIIRAAGRVIPVKVHRGLWSGAHPENSLPAIAECYHAAVARAEIDVHPLRDTDFLVIHDATLDRTTTGTGPVSALSQSDVGTLRLRHADRISSDHPPLLSEVVALISALPSPTRLELDFVSFPPVPWERIERLARILAPVKDRVFVNGYDWNMRRIRQVDPTIAVAYDLLPYLDWVPEGDPDETLLGLPRGAYGYLDAHPLARQRFTPASDYLTDRLNTLARLVPGARELHIRLAAFERMLDDGVAVADLVHRHGLLLDVWTLNANTPHWRERLARVLASGADILTSDTPRALAAAGRDAAT